MIRWTGVVVIVLAGQGVVGRTTAADPVSAPTGFGAPAQLLEEAQQLFHQANELRHRHPQEAIALFSKAATRFQELVQQHGVHNGKLLYNLANAQFLAGDIGHAILNYRRAAIYRPDDPNLRHNLDFARKRRIDQFRLPSQTLALKTLLFWHEDLSRQTRSLLFALSYVLTWSFAGFRLFSRRSEWRWATWLFAGLSLLLFVSLLANTIQSVTVKPGVIIVPEVVARKGDSTSYTPAFQTPLHAGTEFTLAETRGSWLRARLPDDRTCWLPRAVVDFIE